MTITPGKWRMRNGKCAVVEFRTEAAIRWPWMGYMADNKSGISWADDGLWDGPEQGNQDLIAPWDTPEVNWSAMPAWARWVAMDSGGNWYWFTEKPFVALETGSWTGEAFTQNRFGLIPPAYQPTFTGDWTESLIERPA